MNPRLEMRTFQSSWSFWFSKLRTRNLRPLLYGLLTVSLCMVSLASATKSKSADLNSAAISAVSAVSKQGNSPAAPFKVLMTAQTLPFPAPRNFPGQDTFAIQNEKWTTDYSVDSALQSHAQIYLNQYRPDEAVLAVCDLRTGVIRTLVERDSAGVHSRPRLAFAATFPAASLIKILTASAALEEADFLPMDSLPLLGRNHTLYRYQLQPPKRAHYLKISLENAFARSVNPVFGGLGLRIGADALRKMGDALGFNQPQPLSECSPSRFDVPDSGFALAQVACGYTQSTTISPLHALRIARGIGDDGRLDPLSFTPYLRNVGDGHRILTSTAVPEPFISGASLDNLRTLMAATVETGTAKKGFHRAFRSTVPADLDLGGKTGTLDGTEPVGHYEWYIGYAKHRENLDDGIAIAVMVINQRHTVHASELAALVIRQWDHPGIASPVSPIAGKRSPRHRHHYYARR